MVHEFDDFFTQVNEWNDDFSADNVAYENTVEHNSYFMSRTYRRRERKKKRLNRLITIIIVIIVFILAISGTAYIVGATRQWVNSSNNSKLEDFPGPGEGEVNFNIQQGEDALSIAKKLVAAGIIKSQEAFTSIVSANNSVLYPGTYQLKRHMAAINVLKILSNQQKAIGVLQVRSGERVSEIIANASRVSRIAPQEFQNIINSGGQGILPPEAAGKFEGWIEPGSYDVISLKTAENILKAMVKNRIHKLNSLNVPAGAQRQRILIMASIAEAEVNSAEYYGKVTRVILNRMQHNLPIGMDTTVAYGVNIKADKLTDAIIKDSSNPYNTRIHLGLPPSPISTPGDRAIKAALNPTPGDWLYFVTVDLKSGETKFVNTESEFWKIRNEYKKRNPNAN